MSLNQIFYLIKKIDFQFQFALLLIHWSFLIFKPWLAPDCNYPRVLLFVAIPQNLFMFGLFWDFYKKAYLRPSQKKQPIKN